MCIMYLTSLLLAELCICATSWPLIEEQGDTVQEMDFFEMFKKDFGKVYRSASEEVARRRIFAENLDYISQHNRRYRLGKSTFYLGVNAYTDLELHEFIDVTSDNSMGESAFKGHLVRPPVSKDYPASVDWRNNGSVTPVRAQGNCNSGWAFTAVGSIEGQYKQKTGKLVPFSAQQLIDCPYPHPGRATFGCAGGNVTNAYISIAFRTNGIEPDSDYPYEAKNNTCRFKSTLSKARVIAWTEMGPPRTEESLKHMVAGESNGPVAVRIDGSHSSFQHYKGGIYDEPNCSSKSVNHAVLLVGYNTSPDYWIVKNSFGTSWGEEGYIRMIRNKNNQCGSVGGKMHSLDMTPCDDSDPQFPCLLHHGVNYSMSVNFTATENSNKAETVVYGIIAGARVKFMDEDACKGSVKCPITSGMTYTYTDSIFCRKEYPEIKLAVEWELLDENKKPIFCFIIPSEIKP